MVRINDEGFFTKQIDSELIQRVLDGKEFLFMDGVVAFSWLQLA